jgi:hypothetical protein
VRYQNIVPRIEDGEGPSNRTTALLRQVRAYRQFIKNSTESAALLVPEVGPPVTRVRLPSVASITRALSFAKFGRRPSLADITEPLSTPPHSATLTEPPTDLAWRYWAESQAFTLLSNAWMQQGHHQHGSGSAGYPSTSKSQFRGSCTTSATCPKVSPFTSS